MKKINSIYGLTFVIAFLFGSSQAIAATPISVVVNGEKQTYSQSPIQENNSVLVPLRGIFESLDAKVDWNGQNQQITIQKTDKTIILNIGSKTATVNNQSLSLTAPPKFVNGATFVPLRFIGESLGAEVAWEQASQTVKITTQPTGEQNTQPKPQPHPNAPTKDRTVKAEYAAFLSQEAMKDKKYESALIKINEAILLDPTNHLYYYNRGLVYEALGKLDKALDDYEKTISLNGQYEHAIAKLAYELMENDQYDQALSYLTQAIQLNPSNENYYVKRSYIYFHIKNETLKAISDIEKAIQLNPVNKEYKSILNQYNQKEFTDEEINYFLEIAMGNLAYEGLKRWDNEMRIAAYGTPTSQDILAIKTVADEINILVEEEKIKIVKQNENPNVQIYFIPLVDFEDIEENANDYDIAQNFVWNQNGNAKNLFGTNLNRGTILIAQNRTDQLEREFLVRKKITQALGLIHESWKHENSIFYVDKKPKQFSELDKQLIEILYYIEIQPGMDPAKIKRALLK